MIRTWLMTSLVWSVAFGSQAWAADPPPPNILLIYTDDQSYKTVGCYPEAYPLVRTPNIDALAKRGIRFTHCYLGSWCMPSRASLLTGRHPHGIESMRMEGEYPGSTYDPKQCPFWPAVFRQHGYQTAQIGKWHTGTDTGFGRDWDYQIVWNRPKHPDNAGNYYDKQILAINGVEQAEPVTGYSTDNYTKWACDYIRGEHRAKDKPWYLWLCYGGGSRPDDASRAAQRGVQRRRHQAAGRHFSAPARQAELSGQDAVLARRPERHSVTAKSGEAFGDESAKNAKTHQQWVQQVNECVLSIDEGVGQVMAALRESGQLENTLVVFTADQGFAMGEHGFRTKLAPYDANYRSPLIVSQPGTLPEGKVCQQSVGAPDLVMTFFARAGLELPWKMHGRDLSPLLTNPEAAAWPHPLIYEHMGHHYGSDTAKVLKDEPEHAVHTNVPWYVAVRKGNYKYVRYLTPGEIEELYDLAADPEELTNLVGRPDEAKRLAELREDLLAELRRTDAPFLDLLPALKEH